MNKLSDNKRFYFLAEFAYNGADFYGVQEQKNLKTVLGALRQRIEASAGQYASCLFVAARTDRGVHAEHNLATFYIKPPVEIDNFIQGVSLDKNDGLGVVAIKQVESKVNARAGQGKIYRYTIIDNCPEALEKTDPYAWLIAPSLDEARMQKAAMFMVGTMDFSSLRGGGCQAGTTVKEIYRIGISRAGNTISIEVAGRSFLRKMIRNMVGLLVEIGAGFREPDCIPDVLAEKNRESAGIMAPAQGLVLVRILFSET